MKISKILGNATLLYKKKRAGFTADTPIYVYTVFTHKDKNRLNSF